MNVMDYVIAGIILAILLIIGWDALKRVVNKALAILVNSIAGLLILVFLNVYLGWHIPLNIITILICGIFGLPGIGTLIILYLAGMM